MKRTALCSVGVSVLSKTRIDSDAQEEFRIRKNNWGLERRRKNFYMDIQYIKIWLKMKRLSSDGQA